MNELTNYNESVFENINHIDENGIEYWEARELQKVLEYKEWRKFEGVINKAIQACDTSKFNVSEHFVGADKLSIRNNNAYARIKDYKLSRYACYLIVQNADSRKKVIALGQTYFAIQTRKQEISELEYENLTEDEKRFYQRSKVRKENYSLNQTAKKAGVKNFDKFHNAGYKGLYGGETAADISKRKGLRYREDILDNMGSDELAANLFRISLTNQKINNEKIKGETPACDAHFEVGDAIRNTVKQVGGTPLEEMPVPDKSLKELVKKEENKKFIDTIK